MKFEFYVVKSKDDATVLTAKNVLVSDNEVSWQDQSEHERVMTVGKIVTDDERKFEFERDAEEGGGTYALEPLTPESHKEFVEPRLIKPEETEKSE